MSSSSDEEYRSYHRAYPLHDAAEAGDMETLTHILRPARQKPQKPEQALVDRVEGAGAQGVQADGGVVAMDEDGGAKPGEGSAGDGGDVDKVYLFFACVCVFPAEPLIVIGCCCLLLLLLFFKKKS